MGDTCHDAKRVLVWLDEEDRDLDKTVHWMKRILPSRRLRHDIVARLII